MVQSTNGDSEPVVVSSWLRRHALTLGVSLLVTGGLVWLLKAGALPVVPPQEAWSTLRPWTAVAFVLGFLAVHVLRCSRWSLLIKAEYRPSLGRTLAIAFIGFTLDSENLAAGKPATPAVDH